MNKNKNLKKIIAIWLVFLIICMPISFAGYTTGSDAGSLLCGGPIDIRNSFVLSVVTMCLPGILQKAYDYKQIKCQTIKCAYNAVTNNLNPSFCYQQEAYRTCKNIVGEVFAIPPFSILEYYRNIMKQVLSNPVGFLFSSAAGASRKVLRSCTKTNSCNSLIHGASAITLATIDILGVYQTLIDMLKNGFSFGGQETNYCEGIDEIKKELEQIVGAEE